MQNRALGVILLQIALAFSLFYAAWRSFANPFDWLGFFPIWLIDMTEKFISADMLLAAFSIAEIVLGIWLLTGRKVWIPALLYAGLLGSLVVFNWSQMDILFRDASLALCALALAALRRSKKS